MKTTFDCASRILLFSTWLYIVNDGQFSSTKTVLAFYSIFLFLVGFNIVFNTTGDYSSAKTWTGTGCYLDNNGLKVIAYCY